MAPSGVRLNCWCGSRGPGESHLGKIGEEKARPMPTADKAMKREEYEKVFRSLQIVLKS
jgi:hypothetical protein